MRPPGVSALELAGEPNSIGGKARHDFRVRRNGSFIHACIAQRGEKILSAAFLEQECQKNALVLKH